VDDCYSVDLDARLVDVLSHMANHHIGAALVTKEGRLAGIFTAADACRVFAEYLAKQFNPPTDDPEAA
jgi:CBS domain-containing protein